MQAHREAQTLHMRHIWCFDKAWHLEAPKAHSSLPSRCPKPRAGPGSLPFHSTFLLSWTPATPPARCCRCPGALSWQTVNPHTHLHMPRIKNSPGSPRYQVKMSNTKISSEKPVTFSPSASLIFLDNSEFRPVFPGNPFSCLPAGMFSVSGSQGDKCLQQPQACFQLCWAHRIPPHTPFSFTNNSLSSLVSTRDAEFSLCTSCRVSGPQLYQLEDEWGCSRWAFHWIHPLHSQSHRKSGLSDFECQGSNPRAGFVSWATGHPSSGGAQKQHWLISG